MCSLYDLRKTGRRITIVGRLHPPATAGLPAVSNSTKSWFSIFQNFWTLLNNSFFLKLSFELVPILIAYRKTPHETQHPVRSADNTSAHAIFASSPFLCFMLLLLAFKGFSQRYSYHQLWVFFLLETLHARFRITVILDGAFVQNVEYRETIL